MAAWPFWLHTMFGMGLLMMLIYLHVCFAPCRRLGRALDAGDLPVAAASVGQNRKLVAVNLALGLVVVAASAGRYL